MAPPTYPRADVEASPYPHATADLGWEQRAKASSDWALKLDDWHLDFAKAKTVPRVAPQPSTSEKRSHVTLRDCSLVPCRDEGDPPKGAPAAESRKNERIDRHIFNQFASTGVGVLATNGFLLLTAPAERVAPHARVGASMMPNGSGYVTLTGLW